MGEVKIDSQLSRSDDLTRAKWRLSIEPLPAKTRNSSILLLIERLYDRSPEPSKNWIRRHLSLSEREAELTVALIRGDTTRSFANKHGISLHTARNQLKSIFNKLDIHSQKDLVSFVRRETSSPFPG